MLKRVLETHALDVDTAESAEDALDYLIGNRPDVIFMDHQMPGMDGFEAVTIIKKNPDTATIPIMMYTSQEGEVYVGQARALGAVGVLPKKVAHVEVSKVLKALRLIDGEKQEQPDKLSPPAIETSAERDALEALNKDLKALIQDLFEQQRAVIRRDLLDSYESIASRVADEIRPPPEEPEVPQLSEKKASSGFTRNSLVVLVVIALIFALLYWQREQSWAEMKVQNAELLRSIESQRERSTETQDSLQSLQQIAGYQKSIENLHQATINSLEWGANQAPNYHFGTLPLGDEKLAVIEHLTAQLLAIDFSGVVRIETHVADFCLSIAESIGYAVVEDLLAVECDTIGVPLGEVYEIGLGQSPAFANYIQLADESFGGQIRYEIISQGNTDPLIAYPATIDGVSANEWNRIAYANNRVKISIYPDAN